MTTALTFNDVQFQTVTRNNQPWIMARQLAMALGYAREDSVLKIYERNKDEFSDTMTATVNLTVGITPTPVRIFSLRGCHLIAMLARTKVAKAFRRWVLDVLDSLAEKAAKPTRKALPLSRPLPRPALPQVRVAVPSCNKELRTAADIAEAIRLVEDIRERVRREHWPREIRCGNRRDEARYELQWDMFRACNASLKAAVAALCASAEVSDWA